MDKLTVFIALTGFAILLQAGILLAMLLVMRKTATEAGALANEVKTKVLPTVTEAHTILTEVRPKLQVILDHLEEITSTLGSEVKRVDAAVSDAVDRARLQVIRADELLGRTLDRVEQTSDLVHKTVVSPVRQLSGIMQGITAGLEFLFSGRGRRNGGGREERRPVPQDEMFI
jgi:hypothetical protein